MIKKIAIGIGSLILALPLFAGTGLPKDVERFIAKRESCDHFRGEIPPPGDKQRMKELNQEIRKWCKGTDRSLAQLKIKYAENTGVTSQLGEFETHVEAARKAN
jgi:hypothetical protein